MKKNLFFLSLIRMVDLNPAGEELLCAIEFSQ